MNVITTSSVDGVHEPFLIVQRNVYVEPAVPLNVVVGFVVSANDPPDPLTTLHPPVPTEGVFPAKVTVVSPQVEAPVWSGPALDTSVPTVSVTAFDVTDGLQVPLTTTS